MIITMETIALSRLTSTQPYQREELQLPLAGASFRNIDNMFHKFKLGIPFLVIGIRKQSRPQECRQPWKENVGGALVPRLSEHCLLRKSYDAPGEVPSH